MELLGRRGAIAAGVGVIAAVVILVLVMVHRGSDAGAVSATLSSPPPDTGSFTGAFTADFGPPMTPTGTHQEGTTRKETWNLRSVCGTNGCVATASRASGNLSRNKTLVFDDVGGRWLAVSYTPGKCMDGTDTPVWAVFSLQPRPDGTFAGEYFQGASNECGASKRTVTFTRTGDARVDLLDNPATLPARLVSPAQGLHGRYHDTVDFTENVKTLEYDLGVWTECLRSGERCLSLFFGPSGTKTLVFAGGIWSRSTESASCPAGGTSRVKGTAEYLLPQPPQDPIAVLTGHGHQEDTGAACNAGGDFEDKFERTGN